MRSFFPEGERARIKASTVHAFKGAEDDAVIVIDAAGDRYPLVHPHWVFSRAFGESLASVIDSERRLFYVALTRARRILILVAEDEFSPFLSAFRAEARPGDLRALARLGADDDRMEVRVHGIGPARLLLRQRGFRYLGRAGCWSKLVPASDAEIERLVADWGGVSRSITVHDTQGRRIAAWHRAPP